MTDLILVRIYLSLARVDPQNPRSAGEFPSCLGFASIVIPVLSI